MKSRFVVAVLLAGLLAGAGGILLDRYLLSGSAPLHAAENGRKVLYWWDPMMPAFKSEKPGKSPMGMDMVPVYEGEKPVREAGSVTVSSAVVNNLGVRTAPVERTTLTPTIETFGTVSVDESRTAHVHVRGKGWIDRLNTRVEGETVTKGQLLAEVFAPELVSASYEFVRELQNGRSDLAVRGRRKLQSLGLADRQIEDIRRTGEAPDRIQVFAPRAGVIMKLNVAEGMYVEPDTTLMSITDHEVVWVIPEVFERQGGMIRAGMPAEIRLSSFPGRSWTGTVDYIYPDVRPETRTYRLRIRVANTDLALRPNMFATVRLASEARQGVLAIPSEALIRTGAGDRVVLAAGEGRFRPVPVKAGPTIGDKVEIQEGLNEGDHVVTSAQFLLDSESSLSAGLARMDAGDKAAANVQPAWTEATVNSDPTPSRMVKLTHPPIPAISWPAMTMDFAIDPAVKLERFAKGRKLRVALAANPDGTYRVVDVQDAGGRP